ncbi:MAG TPA: hypothetical protein P5140_07580 [Methanofastidiosum sp.]|nr:hypothetical protein [Methanofastidiosum sp.]
MLEIRNVEVFGLNRALVSSGLPMSIGIPADPPSEFPKSAFKRGKILGATPMGSGHDNFLKGIIVQFDVKYPQYWTPEAQRYHWFEIVSSQSKMHRLIVVASLDSAGDMFNKYVDPEIIQIIQRYAQNYKKTDDPDQKYFWFMKTLSNLPMGYELWETISTNYRQLKTMYFQRKNHKLKEDWGAFIQMCEKLPYFLELIGSEK